MAITILTKKQIPQVVAYTDASNTFTQPQYLPIAVPVADSEAVNKKYVDDRILVASTGLDVKESVKVATTTSVGTYTATTGPSGRGQITAAPNTLDGISLTVGSRILNKDHATASARGIYVVTTVGTGANGVWDRASDFDEDSEVSANAFTFVEEGSSLSDTAWVLSTNNPINIGGASGTALTWTQFAGSGVGVSTIAIATANGFSGVSSGGYTPTLTFSTSLAAGNIKSNGAGAFIVGAVDLNSSEVTNTLPVVRGGTGATTLAGVLFGNGTSAVTQATAAQIVAAIGSTFVTNATNSTASSITDDVSSGTTVYPVFVTTNSGNLPVKVASTKLSFVPSTGTLSATAFTGNGSELTSLSAANLTGTIAASVLGATTMYVGTTPVTLNRASANQAMTGILSTAYAGSTSGTITLIPTAVAGANTITMPAVTGTMVTTGDIGTVTNTMLAGSIADSKLNQITTAAKVSTSALTGTVFTLGSTGIGALSTVTTVAGMASITSTVFVGNLTGNASGSAASFTTALGGEVTGNQGTTVVGNAAVIGKVLTGFSAVVGTVSASDSILQAFNKVVANINLKEDKITATSYKAGVAVTGSANGTNLVFTLPHNPTTSTEMIFVNGVLQQRGAGNDYQITGTTVTFEAGNAPQVASIIIATYFI